MHKSNIILKLLCFTLVFFAKPALANDLVIKRLVEDISKIYLASTQYIFLSQQLINQKGGDKNSLFGQNFLRNIQNTYRQKFSQPFPNQSHRAQELLLQAMVEVMEDNRILLNDSDIGFKGLIPATFAFQVSRKLSIKGIGVKIKFTRQAQGVRNPLNTPDEWETATMKKVQKDPAIYFDANAVLNGKPAYRQFTPLPMQPYCLNCHGSMADNPLNKGKDPSQWTDIDMTGFTMENWSIGDFGGGVSISIEKSVVKK